MVHERAGAGAGVAGRRRALTTSTFFYTKDTLPPRFSLLAIKNRTRSGATITWDTNEEADSQVRYGLTKTYGHTSPVNSADVRHHSVTLTGLARRTTYNFQVRSTDPFGNAGASGNFSFTTLD